MSSTSNIDRFRSEQEKKNPSYDEQKRAIETQIKKIEGQMNSPAPRSIDTTELQRQRDALVKNLYQLDKQNLRPSAPTPTVDERINNDFEAFKKQSQRGRDAVATGVLDLAKSGIEAVRWKAADYSRDLQKKVPFSSFDYKIKEWSDVVDKSLAGASGVIEAKQEKLFPKDAKFGDHLARGAGSMIAFYVPGLGIARGATMLSTVSPRAAMLVGGAASTFLEAASEAGSVYEQNKKRGLPDELASEKASNAFWWNSALVGLTNVLGPLSPEARNMARRAFMSAGTEGVQEFGQQIISNINTGRPWDEGVYESAAIGAILGGGAGAMITPVQSKDAPLKSNATRFQSFESSNQTKLLAEFYGITPDTLLTEVQSIGTDAELQNLETTLAQKYGKDQTAFMDFVDTKLGDNATPADYNAMENARIDAEKFEAPAKFQSDAMDNKMFIQTTEAEQIFRKYFSEEEVPIDVVKRIVTPSGERAFGQYKDGIVTFIENPLASTPQHEAVHAYLDLFTGAQERSKILNQIIKETDAVNEIEAEEKLADGFVEYARDNEVQGLSAKVMQYLSNAWNRIKSFFGKPDRVNQLYRDIVTKKRGGDTNVNTMEPYQRQVFESLSAIPVYSSESSAKFQAMSELPDDPELTPFREELKDKTNLLRDAVDYAEGQIREATPVNEEADSLITLAEGIRSALRQSPRLPGGQTRTEFYQDLASVDTVPEITSRIRAVAERSNSPIVRRQLQDIAENMRATGKYDDVADFKPFQDAIVEGRPKVQDTSKLDIVERAENVMREVGDFNIDENTKMSDLLDEIYLLESQVNERTKSQYSAKKKSAKQSALKLGKGARPISGQSQRIERETTVSGRDLLKAIETVSKGKAQEYKVRLREAVGQAKEAQRIKDREAYSLANMRRESIKEDLIKEIQRLVPLNRRGRFLKAVKNTKTRGQLKKALERVDAEVERQKRNDLMSRIKNIANSPLSSVDVAYRNDIERILAGIDLSKPTKATLKKLRSRMDYIERTGGFSIPQNLREEVSRLAKDPLSDIETDALQRILDALETLISQGKVSRAMKVSQMQREKERAIERLLTTTVNIDPIVNKMKEGYNYTSKQLRESVRKSRGLWRALNFFTQTDTMDGGMNFQGSNTELAKQMYDAEQQAITATRERMGTVILRIANEVGNQPKLFTEQSQAEMMAAIAYDQGLESQMEAAGWGTSRPDLTEGQEKIINILREEVGDGSYQGEKRFPLMAAVNAMINNEYTAKVPNYFKISYVDSVLTEDEDAMFKSRFGTAKMNAAASLSAMEGMMKSRTPGVARPLRTDMVNLAFEAIAQQEWIINVEPTLRNIYSVVNSKEYTQAGGIKAKETWNRRIQNVAMAWRKEAIQFREEAVFNATSNLGLAYMAFKTSTAAIQFSQVAVGTSYVLGKYGPATAVKFFWMSSLNIFKPSTVRDAAAESPVVRFRESGDPLTSIIMRQTGVLDQSKWAKEVQVFEDAMQDAMNDRMAVIRTFLKWRRKAGRVGMDIVKFTDVRATAAQFEAFQELFEDLGATEEEARGDAEILTMVINNDASATFRPEIFEDVSSIRDPEAKFLKRQLLLFQSFNINTLAMTWHNLMKNAMKPTVMPDGTKVRGGLHSGFYALLGLAFLAAGNYGADEMRSVINQYIQGKKYEDDPSIVAAIIMSNLRQIPIAGDLFQIIRNGMIGKYMGSRQIGSPALALALREAEAIGSFLKKPSVKKFVKAAEAVPTSLGVPGTGQAFDLLERLTPTKKKVSTAF